MMIIVRCHNCNVEFERSHQDRRVLCPSCAGKEYKDPRERLTAVLQRAAGDPVLPKPYQAPFSNGGLLENVGLAGGVLCLTLGMVSVLLGVAIFCNISVVHILGSIVCLIVIGVGAVAFNTGKVKLTEKKELTGRPARITGIVLITASVTVLVVLWTIYKVNVR
jgi:hypothetical protein